MVGGVLSTMFSLLGENDDRHDGVREGRFGWRIGSAIKISCPSYLGHNLFPSIQIGTKMVGGVLSTMFSLLGENDDRHDGVREGRFGWRIGSAIKISCPSYLGHN